MKLWLWAAFLLGCVHGDLPDGRPALENRTFTSGAIEKLIEELRPLLKTPDLATMFSNVFPNTLDTTIYAFNEKLPDAFVITGDINAMWLRDSQNQLQVYVPYASQDARIDKLVAGTINRQANSILIDPYANAFNYNSSTASGQDHQTDMRKPKMQPSVFEGKYELDSLCSFLKLSYWYSREVGAAHFSEAIDVSAKGNWAAAAKRAVSVIARMQTVSGQEPTMDMPYLFQRNTNQATDTLLMTGRGPPTNPSVMLSRQLFRPSDDATTLAFNIPGNSMACVELTHTVELLDSIEFIAQGQGQRQGKGNRQQDLLELRGQVASVQQSLCQALRAVVQQTQSQPLPFEIDGFGGAVFLDDANIPSLLSLPILGYMSATDPIYQATRRAVWSSRNPFFYSGKAGEGIGGPHEGPDLAWPMAVAVYAMTSSDEGEISSALQTLLTTTAGTGMMHEAFNVHDANKFTRPWFAWANGVFAELILQLIHTHPLLVLKGPEVVAQAQALVRVPVSLQAQRDQPRN